MFRTMFVCAIFTFGGADIRRRAGRSDSQLLRQHRARDAGGWNAKLVHVRCERLFSGAEFVGPNCVRQIHLRSCRQAELSRHAASACGRGSAHGPSGRRTPVRADAKCEGGRQLGSRRSDCIEGAFRSRGRQLGAASSNRRHTASTLAGPPVARLSQRIAVRSFARPASSKLLFCDRFDHVVFAFLALIVEHLHLGMCVEVDRFS